MKYERFYVPGIMRWAGKCTMKVHERFDEVFSRYPLFASADPF